MLRRNGSIDSEVSQKFTCFYILCHAATRDIVFAKMHVTIIMRFICEIWCEIFQLFHSFVYFILLSVRKVSYIGKR